MKTTDELILDCIRDGIEVSFRPEHLMDEPGVLIHLRKVMDAPIDKKVLATTKVASLVMIESAAVPVISFTLEQMLHEMRRAGA